MRITLIEDNLGLAKGIAYRLQDVGHAVDVLHDGDAAEAFLRETPSDLIILDINLPGVDGLTLLKGLRARHDMRPVILLTARSNTADRVTGLDAGADDYLVKPFEMAELEARVRAVARRPAPAPRAQLSIGKISFDSEARQIQADGQPLDIPRREISMFECLLSSKGRLVTKSALLDYAYGVGAEVEEAVVEVYVSRLRARLKPFGVTIKAQRGLGYQLLEEAAP